MLRRNLSVSFGCAVVFSVGVLYWLAGSQSVSVGDDLLPLTEAQPAPAKKTVSDPPPGRANGVFDLSAQTPNEVKIQTALTHATHIEFIDTPLRDCLDFLADSQAITILLDENSLNDIGLSNDEPINHTLSGVKLESVLKIILKPKGLTYIIEDEVLKVLSEVDAAKRRELKVYNIGYLKQVGIDPEALGKTVETLVTAAPQKTAAKVEPQTPVISVLSDLLVVSASPLQHAQIRELLIQLDRRWMDEYGVKL